MVAIPLLLALTVAAPATPPCGELPATSTLADQFTCYKDSGRKIMVPGTGFISGFDGPGCILGVWADRMQVATCNSTSFNRKTVLVLYSSIRAVEDNANTPYVTLLLTQDYVQVDCRVVTCVEPAPVVTPTPAPALRSRLIATPRKP